VRSAGIQEEELVEAIKSARKFTGLFHEFLCDLYAEEKKLPYAFKDVDINAHLNSK
jgi:hypothetical protein